jgi:hypothetical protein
MIPSVIQLTIQSASQRRISLWLPVFLLWPVFVALLLIALPPLLIADLIIAASGNKIQLCMMLVGLLTVVSSLHGARIRVNNPKHNTVVNITIL